MGRALVSESRGITFWTEVVDHLIDHVEGTNGELTDALSDALSEVEEASLTRALQAFFENRARRRLLMIEAWQGQDAPKARPNQDARS